MSEPISLHDEHTVEYNVAELVPHSGAMSLLTEVIAYGDNWLEAAVDISPASMFADADGVPAWVGLEYLAQAVAACAGLQERRAGGQPKLGFLLGSRKYESSESVFRHGQRLKLKVTCELQGENGLASYSGELSGDNLKATARVNVFQPDDAERFLKDSHS